MYRSRLTQYQVATHTHVHSYTRTLIHTDTHTRIHTYTHTRINSFRLQVDVSALSRYSVQVRASLPFGDWLMVNVSLLIDSRASIGI